MPTYFDDIMAPASSSPAMVGGIQRPAGGTNLQNQTQGGRNPVTSGVGYNTGNVSNPGAAAFDPRRPSTNNISGIVPQTSGPQQPTTAPGNNYYNPGLGEQAFNTTQNQLLNDPWSGAMQDQYNQTQNASSGEQWLDQNMGSLSGPGQGEQYWNQMSGQYMDPYAGEQFTREATQNFSPTGQSGSFYNQANSQLGGGTQAESNMAGIASGYGANGTYQGGNNALGQYGANASYGPMAAQGFFDQVGGSYDSMGRYSDPNLAAGQYAQTQGAFGDMPIAEFDPFYDRASQLATQDYNRQAAGRGVYGSSEALSGVGNVITDIEAQRANRSFDAEMQRTQEQRMRQQLLGEQARMGDLSSQGAFAANMSGLQTFGTLANNAGNQTLGQQEMLGNQARAADQTGLEAFDSNLRGAETYANINRDMGQLELDRNQLLGNLANNADVNETNRYTASTNAMNRADQMQLDRSNSGADIAFRTDENNRANFDSQAGAANQQAQLSNDRTRLGADIASEGSSQDLRRIESFNNIAQGAEGQRLERLGQGDGLMAGVAKQMQDVMGDAFDNYNEAEHGSAEDYLMAQMAPYIENANLSKEEKAELMAAVTETAKAVASKPKGG